MSRDDLFRRSFEAGTAFFGMTRERAEALVKDLVKAGEVQKGKAQKAIDEVLERSRKGAEELRDLVRREVADQVASLGLATKEDIARLEGKLSAMAGATTAGAPPAGGAASPSATKAAGAAGATSAKASKRGGAAAAAGDAGGGAEASPTKVRAADKAATKGRSARKTASSAPPAAGPAADAPPPEPDVGGGGPAGRPAGGPPARGPDGM
jgi:polyhydroxyalkanoate synthesis regulator phasin